MASFFDELPGIKRETLAHLLVFGYIHNQQKLLTSNVPDGITIECMKYFFEQFIGKFMNGMNILSRDWKRLYKNQMIEYDSDGAEQKGGEPGSHIHKGKLINIVAGEQPGSSKIIIKDEIGADENFALHDIKIKLKPNGSRIITYQDTTKSFSACWKCFISTKTKDI